MKTAITFTLALLTAFQPLASYACRVAYSPPSLSDELVSFNSCQELEIHVDKLLSKNSKSSWGWSSSREASLRKRVAEASNQARSEPSMQMMDMDAKAEAPASPAQVTGTNNQVAKVDEADFVKFDGRYIYQLHNGTLKILKAWPARELHQIASLPIPGQPQEMLITATNAVIIAAEGQNLKATIVDTTQRSQPRVLTEFDIPGQYKTARLVGNTLRIVNQDYNPFETLWRAQTSSSNSWFQEETVSRKLHIPPTTQSLNGIRRNLDVIKDCKSIYVPKDVAPKVLTRLITIDLNAKKYDETMAFIQSDVVYASEDAIFLAQAGHNKNGTQQTAIHKFSFAPAQGALYQASGIINGHLINQFALDEHNGYLRLATNGTEHTGGNLWGGGGQWQQVSRVQVLAQKGKRLKSIGQTSDLAKGERLYSARFDGDRGYIVTFRQVDPLFTIDLKNPRRPKVMGELKVPGFSTYIHMLDKSHLLTVGQDADEKTGRVRGLKLSVFDVRDFSRPREVKSLIFKSDVSSESSYEHKAFSFYRQKGVLAIPASRAASLNS
ncbi:MAG: beta-propeller domain-containing protein, partial [Bdellovibrionales bacterium]